MISLPRSTGVSFKAEHFSFFTQQTKVLNWLEVHPENYMGDGGQPHVILEAIRRDFELSFHGVGMSLGSADGISDSHLTKLVGLVKRYQPAQVSEHLSWSHWKQNYFNDLLPLPYTRASLDLVAENIHKVQEALGRTIVVENPSTYLTFSENDFSETEFLTQLCEITDCGLLLDINNVFVSCENHGLDASEYLKDIPAARVGEIHLAGHTIMPLIGEKVVRVDDHGSEVSSEVWSLYRDFCQAHNQRFPTLIEWDTHIPPAEELIQEAGKAQKILEQVEQ